MFCIHYFGSLYIIWQSRMLGAKPAMELQRNAAQRRAGCESRKNGKQTICDLSYINRLAGGVDRPVYIQLDKPLQVLE